MKTTTTGRQRRWWRGWRNPEIRMSLMLWLVIGGLYVSSRPEFVTLYRYGKALRLDSLTTLLDILETKTLDVRFIWRGETVPRDDIVIVAVDEKADDELGRWWSSGRRWLARLVDILHGGGARVVGFDLIMDEPNEGAVLAALDDIRAYYGDRIAAHPPNPADGEFVAYLEQIEREYDDDLRLAEAIRQAGNVVLGYYFMTRREAGHLSPEDHAARQAGISNSRYAMFRYPPGATRRPLDVPAYAGVETNLPLFADAARRSGYFNAIAYPADGYIRKSPLIIRYRDDYYPSLALQVAYTYLNTPLPPLPHVLGKHGRGGIAHVQLGDITIPTDESGQLMINYYGRARRFAHYAISDVVLGRIPPETFRDKIVLIGFTAPIYQDLHPTSFQYGYPGVETHATVAANILDQDFLTRPESAVLADLGLILVLGILLGLVLPRTRPISGALTLGGCLAAVFGIAYYAFVVERIWLNIVYPALFVLVNYVVITSYKYLTEERRKKAIKSAFQHYVAPTVVNQMLEHVDQLQLGGQRKVLTALFADIRGFTSISEQMSPEALVRFLNEYLSAMTQIVLRYEGTVDKYMGDAIMAFYGAPLDQADHAARACRTALDMMTRLRELRAGWQARGLPPMKIGIGLNSGDMSVGNMGSEERFDYTIMGDHVNLASRLEGITKHYGVNIVISQFTYALIRDMPFTVRKLDAVRVKGKQEPVVIYELRGYGAHDAPTAGLFAAFGQGLAAYENRQWNAALTHFQEALRIDAADEPSRLYCERCDAYRAAPPPDDWDGVCAMTTK